MQKIPFAVEYCSGELLEIGQVESGRDCGCVCFSCGQSVIARKGEVNQWHFAHDSKGPVPPHSICDISFYVCCKRFVIEQLLKNEILTLSTPSYSVSEKQLISTGSSFKSITDSMLVTEKRQLTVTGYAREGYFDLSVKVDTHVIHLVLDYPGRLLPQIVSLTNAVLLIDLAFIADCYEGIRTTQGLIQKAITELVSIDIKYKRWLFHPRELAVRAHLIKKLDAELTSVSLVDQPLGNNSLRESQTLLCKMCNEKWRWTTGEQVICKKCDTHLFVVPDG